jgi:hypothetical protein
MDVHRLVCWALHRREREILIAGILPWQIDAVVFCWRCDHFRGRAVKVFKPALGHGAG